VQEPRAEHCVSSSSIAGDFVRIVARDAAVIISSMSLTMGSGPLATKPGGDFNFGWDGAPAHRLFFQPYPRRLRALVGDRVVLDSVRASLLFESNLPARVYVPFEDLDGELLERTRTSTHCPFKGDATYWTLRVGDRVLEDAVWGYEEPIEAAPWLLGQASLYWEKADAWFCEDERLFGHLRDPYHRVDVFEASRPVRVRVGGALVAETARAKFLYETGLPMRVYVPGADVAAGVLSQSRKRTTCPYKGEATYWDVRVDGTSVAGGAWSYETPLLESLAVARHLSFDGEDIEVEVDEPADRFRLAGSGRGA
jgi:uncharacterized protein (DUF427 family)